MFLLNQIIFQYQDCGMQELFRAIPSMDICLKAIKDENADLARLPQNLAKDLVTDFWNMIRVLIREKKITDASSLAIENQLGPLLAHVRKSCAPCTQTGIKTPRA